MNTTPISVGLHREAEYYAQGGADRNRAKSEVGQLIQKQFQMRRNGGTISSKESSDGDVSAEEAEAARKSRLIAAASTSIKIAGLKLNVRLPDTRSIYSICFYFHLFGRFYFLQ